MKYIIMFFLAVGSVVACSDNKAKTDTITDSDTAGIVVSSQATGSASISALLSGYFELKNAFADDNSAKASDAGNSIKEELKKMNEGSMSADQRAAYDDVQASLQDHAKHIADNKGKIDHQREHFDLMSTDMYDLLKVFPIGQTVYVNHCPMFNDKKGANWLSEVKEIRNPYYGKEMLDCGTVKEEIKASR